ncbi:MAG: hypothetical protein MZV49_14680 [Rhodopseudomonas palustris]|nr:hypothetical protein [Rhodopseudomonas palustris]
MIAAAVPDDALVLPGHGVPFYGLQVRIGQLAAHHEERCEVIAEACIATARTAAELVPIVFNKHVLDAHQAGFAAGEVIAHVNYLLAQGRLKQVDHRAGICDGLYASRLREHFNCLDSLRFRIDLSQVFADLRNSPSVKILRAKG